MEILEHSVRLHIEGYSVGLDTEGYSVGLRTEGYSETFVQRTVMGNIIWPM